jgi:hypothetical protein
MTKHQQAETPQPGTVAKPAAPAELRDPFTRSHQELKEMTLDELLDSLPLKPWDKDDPDPLVQKAIQQSSTTAPADRSADDQPAASAEWRSPTMLTPEELESLRQEAKQSSEQMRAILAARRAKS